MICAYCKSRVMESDRKCPACGSAVFVAVAVPFRPASGEYGYAGEAGRVKPAREPEAVFSPVSLRREMPGSPRNRWLALLLCVLGGAIGLHRFYAGKIGTGILFLLTGGVFGVGVIVDAAAILFGRFRDSDGFLLSSGWTW